MSRRRVRDTTETPPVQTVQRALGLLEHLASAGGEASLTDMAQACGLAIPTAHRLVRTLATAGYVSRLPAGRFQLGPTLIRLGRAATTGWSATVQPYLDTLAEQTGETASLATLDGCHVVYVAEALSQHAMRVSLGLGSRAPAHTAAAGKALLAQLSPGELLSVMHATSTSATVGSDHVDTRTLRRELIATLRRGYAVEQGESEVGVWGLAVNVALPTELPRAALSVSGPEARLRHRLDAVVASLRHVAEQLAITLRAPASST